GRGRKAAPGLTLNFVVRGKKPTPDVTTTPDGSLSLWERGGSVPAPAVSLQGEGEKRHRA
ncbi:hypothetical protein, partial [Superficieibacter sp.]|uniref:hypothetical protein n=1 Tax=Superficieibacter sp. TaxID=2303322 RepID=UPI0028A6F744